jgi:hypothetical protein
MRGKSREVTSISRKDRPASPGRDVDTLDPKEWKVFDEEIEGLYTNESVAGEAQRAALKLDDRLKVGVVIRKPDKKIALKIVGYAGYVGFTEPTEQKTEQPANGQGEKKQDKPDPNHTIRYCLLVERTKEDASAPPAQSNQNVQVIFTLSSLSKDIANYVIEEEKEKAA